MRSQIHPVILCGGSGTRLWPLSRKSYPKQFSRLTQDRSMFQSTVQRYDDPEFAAPLIVTSEPFRFIATEQLTAVGRRSAEVIIEPEARNTAPAVLAAAMWLERRDPEALMLVSPSDHVLTDTTKFRDAVGKGRAAAEAGRLVTFGIQPTHAETGYGYLEVATAGQSAGEASPLTRFVEKPDAASAERMLAEGNYLWNSGIFLFKAKALVTACEIHAPALVEPVRLAVAGAQSDLGFVRLEAEPWRTVESISIDYAVMEHADNLSVVAYDGGWSDLGSWDAVWHQSEPDADGTVTSGNAIAINCSDTLLRSESSRLQLVGIGLQDMVAIAMPDAVLVAPKSESQRVKQVVEVLKERGVGQAESFPVDYRPWGWFESLVIGARFQVKRIVVRPGGSLSLQSHRHRSEHWIVVEGTAKVTIDAEVRMVTENQSVYIPVGAVHRMENEGKIPLVLIEVQTGAYLGEDDIVRYEDVYRRN